MRRRIWFAGTAVAAVSLAAGAGMATAASPTTPAKPTVLKCSIALTTAPPAGSNSVSPPEPQGSDYGPIHCPTKTFGGGVEAVSFTTDDAGDTLGKYTQYFGDGTVSGTFDLTPNEGSGLSFTSGAWTGTVKVTGATGVFAGTKGLKGKKNLGVMTCTSPDTVHLSCHEKVKVTP